jgi:hypothetical protein
MNRRSRLARENVNTPVAPHLAFPSQAIQSKDEIRPTQHARRNESRPF